MRRDPAPVTRSATTRSATSRAVVAAFAVAALCGTVHAAFSAYWAAGGRALLGTVGRWAVDAAAHDPAG